MPPQKKRRSTHPPSSKTSTDVCNGVTKQRTKHDCNRVAKKPNPVSKWLLLSLVPHSGDQRKAGADGRFGGSKEKPCNEQAGEALCCGMTPKNNSPDDAVHKSYIKQPSLIVLLAYLDVARYFPMGKRTMRKLPTLVNARYPK